MRKHILIIAAVAHIALFCPGCVQRRLSIRSKPEGAHVWRDKGGYAGLTFNIFYHLPPANNAPVWVDERYVGLTPVDVEFYHYGNRRIRVGPIRNEKNKIIYQSSEAIFRLKPPWYQRFPLDFFSEVLWPFTITDQHHYIAELAAAEKLDEDEADEKIRLLLEEAQELREEADRPPEDF